MEKVSESLFFGIYTCRLLSAVINSQKPPELPQQIDLERLYAYQTHQSVANMAYWALKDLDIPADKLKPFEDEYKMTLLREARFEIAGTQVFIELEKQGIPFIPVKGVILKKLYDTESFRSFTDFDIYIGDKDKETQQVMESLGFELKGRSEYDTKYFKKPSISFEMHRNLFEDDYSFDGYFDNPLERAVLKPDSKCYYMLKNEDFYIHVFCHLFKHFTFGGCGLRQFMDIYVMDKKLSLDRDYIKSELEKLNLVDFYNTVQQLVGVMFGGEKPDERLLEICDYIFSNGTFGTDKIIAVNQYNKEKDNNDKNIVTWKIAYFVDRWRLSYSGMKEQYKILEKVPVLLPFCWIHKAFRVLFFRRDVLRSQINDVENYNSDYADYIAHIRDISGVPKN